jgi:formate/nitrite transporter FocA (FNT family)
MSVYAVTFVIGLGGLHHSIAGAVEMMLALWSSREFTLAAAAAFLGVSLIGNLVGGSTFVALLNHAHIRTMQTVGQPPGGS